MFLSARGWLFTFLSQLPLCSADCPCSGYFDSSNGSSLATDTCRRVRSPCEATMTAAPSPGVNAGTVEVRAGWRLFLFPSVHNWQYQITVLSPRGASGRQPFFPISAAVHRHCLVHRFSVTTASRVRLQRPSFFHRFSSCSLRWNPRPRISEASLPLRRVSRLFWEAHHQHGFLSTTLLRLSTVR